MPKEKAERNLEFITAWKEQGLSNKKLEEKFNLSPGGVKGLKARLRKKDPNLYTSQRPELTEIEREVIESSGRLIKFASKPDKTISPQVDKSTSPLVHKRATYYLSPEIVRKIKEIALSRDIDRSELVRKILSEWISQQVDK